MAIAEGRHGKVTVSTTAPAVHLVAELKSWSISGINRNMIDVSRFQDDVMRFKPGLLDPGTIQFSGFFDGTDSTGQVQLITSLSSGGAISNDGPELRKMRLWANDDATFDNYGFFSCTGSSGAVYMQSMDVNINNNGVVEISFTGKVSDGIFEWSTST
jgi:hypothetical protein